MGEELVINCGRRSLYASLFKTRKIMLDFYISDREAYTQDCIAPIVNNKQLDKFDPIIRQSWIEVAVEMNADLIYNTPEIFYEI